MSPKRQAALRAAIERVMHAGQIPGLALAFAIGSGPVERLIVGEDADGRPIAADALFTVASITKLATALVVLRLIDAGALALDEPIASYLPDAAAAQPGVNLRTLLSHTSGLPLRLDEMSPAGEYRDRPAQLRAALATPLEAPPSTRVQYSNPGYALIGLAVERLAGLPFAEVLDQQVLRPLGIEAYLGIEPPRRVARLADVRGPGLGTDRERFNSPHWRGLGQPWGGLVSTLDGALALVRTYLQPPPGYLHPDTLAEAIRNQAGELGGGQIPPLIWPHCPWGLGPELRGQKVPHWAPAEASPDSFGHAGATGCLAWADPAADVAWAYIGTRVADNGWLIRHARALGTAILATVK